MSVAYECVSGTVIDEFTNSRRHSGNHFVGAAINDGVRKPSVKIGKELGDDMTKRGLLLVTDGTNVDGSPPIRPPPSGALPVLSAGGVGGALAMRMRMSTARTGLP